MPLARDLTKFTTASQILTNFDFTDVLTNSAYILAYGLRDEDSNDTMIRQQLKSTEVADTILAGGGGTAEEEYNFDFDFDTTETIEGTMYVAITHVVTGVGAQGTGHVVVRILHVDSGATETEIGAAVTSRNVAANAGATKGQRTTLSWSGIDQRFKKGEKLRVEVVSHITSANASSSNQVYFDGGNRDVSGVADQHGATLDTNLILYMPLRLQ